MAEIIALAIGEDKGVSQTALNEWFSTNGYNLIDENEGRYSNDTNGESFKCSVYEQTGYMVFQETENLLPNEVFDFILNLPYDDALISMGEDDGYSTSVDTEMNLNKFKKEFLKAQTEGDE